MTLDPVILVAVITVGGTILVALIGVGSAALVRMNGRLRRLEKRDKLSWLYIRSLIDHAYKHAPGVPLPDPPKGWLDEEE